MSKLDCPIVRDLLPLYIDQVTSPETAQAVEAHLADCPDCRREYESLKADLPETPMEGTDTSRQFGDMMKKTKRKETLQTGLTIALLLALLLAIFICQPPKVKDNEDVIIYRTYEFEHKEEGTCFFFLYSAPFYNDHISSSAGIREKDGKMVLQIDFQRDLLHGKVEGSLENATYFPGNDVDEVLLGDEVIWTREANGDDPVPDYVYEYTSQAWTSWAIELDGKENYTDFPAPFILAFDYKEGRQIVWDLDGNVLKETP